jgi:hypothetical protein
MSFLVSILIHMRPLHSHSQVCPAYRDQIFTKKASCVGQSSWPTKTTHVVCALDLINRCVHSLVNNVVLFLACQYELHASWEAHLLVAQTRPPRRRIPLARGVGKKRKGRRVERKPSPPAHAMVETRRSSAAAAGKRTSPSPSSSSVPPPKRPKVRAPPADRRISRRRFLI